MIRHPAICCIKCNIAQFTSTDGFHEGRLDDVAVVGQRGLADAAFGGDPGEGDAFEAVAADQVRVIHGEHAGGDGGGD
jgi:hypothetical protein